MYINLNNPALINKIKINYSTTEIVDINKIQTIKHDIVRETLRYLKINEPIEITSMADLSAGTGLGSSSSYTVGLIRALNSIKKRYISIQDLAEEACKIEIELIGKPIGKQDQYAAAYGGIITLEINELGDVKVTPLRIHEETIHELENRLLMFYTGINRDANKILEEQSQKAKIDETVTIKSMHRIKEIGREIKRSLENDKITLFGKLMHEHWMEKKKISSKISSPKIDHWYDVGLKNGALGGKIMGAGGGGFLVFCSEVGKRKELRIAMEKEGLKFMDFKFDWEGSKTLVDI